MMTGRRIWTVANKRLLDNAKEIYESKDSIWSVAHDKYFSGVTL